MDPARKASGTVRDPTPITDRPLPRLRSASGAEASEGVGGRKTSMPRYYSGRGNDNVDTSKSAVAKTSLIFLGSVAAATVVAHKYWPKGFIYGDKEAWELEKKAKKADKILQKEETDGRQCERDRNRDGNGSGSVASNSSRELAYRDRPDRRAGYRGGEGRASDGRGGYLLKAEEEVETVAYRDGRSRSRGPRRWELPADQVIVRENTTRVIRDRSRDGERNLDYNRYLQVSDSSNPPPRCSRSLVNNSGAADPPSPSSTTMAVAGSPISERRPTREQQQTYYPPTASSSQRYVTIERSSGGGSSTTSGSSRRSASVERNWQQQQPLPPQPKLPQQQKYYYEDEISVARKVETLYVYRDDNNTDRRRSSRYNERDRDDEYYYR
ncbi:hypothetical protein B0H66DRAFT_643204 [Apodospora peruviana]|uniref:Uncharacterized protein n=1 Tax=Apodospora peruviana TaxID=516989 RepID=A0AAE0HVK0_9PEZI|nr:hypothetical protein B0H66DRAFT_643204 [Apodospora peruviana]